MTIEITSSLKKRFCKDFKLPISLYDEPYFTYFKELYDKVYDVETKFKWLEEAVIKCGDEAKFFNINKEVANNIKTKISSSPAYQKFLDADLQKDFKINHSVESRDIYIVPNAGKELISIDLNKANFNALCLFGLKEDLNIDSYKDLIQTETNLEYFLNSKMIRQVMLGELNPNKQQKIQKYIISELCGKLLKEGCELTSASTDEIIISNKTDVKEVEQILKDVREEFKFFRVEKFRFDRITDEYSFFAKYTQTKEGEKLEFKNVPGHLFSQVYKKHFNMELNSYDLLFIYEGFMAEYKEKLFKDENKYDNKSKRSLK